MTTPPDDTTESLREQVESVIEDDHEGSEMLAILIVDRVILPALERQREDARATLRTVEEMQRTVAAGLRAEAERLRGELATARRSHAEYDELLRGVLVSRDANIERAESAEAEMKRQRQRAEQAEAENARLTAGQCTHYKGTHDQWHTSPVTGCVWCTKQQPTA